MPTAVGHQLLLVLARYAQVPLAGVELPCGRQVQLPLVVLGAFHRALVLPGGFEPESVLQEPLLRRLQGLPSQPASLNPPPQVLALDDDLPSLPRHAAALGEAVLHEPQAALPPRVPDRRPPRIDLVQCFPPLLRQATRESIDGQFGLQLLRARIREPRGRAEILRPGPCDGFLDLGWLGCSGLVFCCWAGDLWVGAVAGGGCIRVLCRGVRFGCSAC